MPAWTYSSLTEHFAARRNGELFPVRVAISMVSGPVVDRKRHYEAAAAGSEQVANPASSHVVHVCGIQFVPAEFE
jgi:hypothetical protein